MKQIRITKFNGKWYFNGLLYQDLSGNEKTFVDSMLEEVKIDEIDAVRKPNAELKRFNYQFAGN